jgi:Flp pilus assembly protein TadG
MRKFTWLRDRKGGAAVEFAVIASVMVLLLLGSIELINVVRLQGKLKLAAGEYAELIAGQSTVTEGAPYANGTHPSPGGTLTDMCNGVANDLLPYPNTFSAVVGSTTVQGGAPNSDWSTDNACPVVTFSGSFYETIFLASIAESPNSMFTQTGSPSGPLVPGDSAIEVQLTYYYHNVLPFFLGTTITLTANGIARPRPNTTITCTYSSGATNHPCPSVY